FPVSLISQQSPVLALAMPHILLCDGFDCETRLAVALSNCTSCLHPAPPLRTWNVNVGKKKSREESCGEGSGVEILENKPYTDGPGGTGQYTHKVYHIGMHIPSWFRSILPKAALRVEEESWNAYPYTRTRYTCPFVEKFSIDIETYYKPDTGNQADVFNLSATDKRQRTIGLRKVMVRAHRQAWCWQDEWYGLTIEDIRQLELETQLALARKMAQFCQIDEDVEANGGAPSSDKEQEAKEAMSSIAAEETVTRSVETLQPRGVLTKQWSTSSRSSRSSKRGGDQFL
ncbi:hypothetical protein XENOCAPTIV_030589, partial [Xenoophorus captivus]